MLADFGLACNKRKELLKVEKGTSAGGSDHTVRVRCDIGVERVSAGGSNHCRLGRDIYGSFLRSDDSNALQQNLLASRFNTSLHFLQNLRSILNLPFLQTKHLASSLNQCHYSDNVIIKTSSPP